MTDRELLEFAAKAVGGKFSPGTGKRRTGDTWDHWEWYGPEGIQMPDGRLSFPLTNGGDALRMAVALCMNIEICSLESYAVVRCPGAMSAFERRGEDPEASTCRAIVRAAAEVGRVMP